MQQFSTKIGKKKISCTALGVREHLDLEGRISLVLAQGLKSAFGQSVSDVFKDGVSIVPVDDEEKKEETTGANMIIAAMDSSLTFRRNTDWEALIQLIEDCCSYCKLEGEKTAEQLHMNDLDPLTREHYQVFFWFVECQLGNFTAWKQAKKLIGAALADLLNIGKANSKD